MIAHLRGIVLEKYPNQVIVEIGGVGYDVTIPVSTFAVLPAAGEEVRLRVHTNVREDAFQLFGFHSAQEKTIFEKLISVSGIGPKLAITVLSGLAAPAVIAAIRGGQVEQLVRIPGVGKKTAERMILELRDKLELGTESAASPGAAASQAYSDVERDVLSALGNLGCARPAAELAIRKARESGSPLEFEPLFRKSLELVR